MKHAGPNTLRALQDLLNEIRKNKLKETKPGIFYLGRTAFLHFHEDPTGLFADIKVGLKFERHPVSGRAQQQRLLKLIKQQLA